VSQEYPEDCLQTFLNDWWVRSQATEARRGRLIWAFIPHVDQQLYHLVPEGRSEPTEHRTANYRVEAFEGKEAPNESILPVAALPGYPGEVRLLYRAKRRPALVLSIGGSDVPRNLKTGSARHQTNPTLLVAPYYGADQGGATGGWKPEFVTRIRRCEYPQYMWDSLPFKSRKESILRLDHLQPIGKHGKSYELSEFELHPDALEIVDEYLLWLMSGSLPDGIVSGLRKELLGLE
jgi:hypothetical protein